jgi:hypothetical protein
MQAAHDDLGEEGETDSEIWGESKEIHNNSNEMEKGCEMAVDRGAAEGGQGMNGSSMSCNAT